MNEVEAIRPLYKKIGNMKVISYEEKKRKKKKNKAFVYFLIPRYWEQQVHVIVFT